MYPAPAGLNGHGHAAADLFAAELAAVTSRASALSAGLHIGQDKARQVQAYLETLTPAGRSIRGCARSCAANPTERNPVPANPPGAPGTGSPTQPNRRDQE